MLTHGIKLNAPYDNHILAIGLEQGIVEHLIKLLPIPFGHTTEGDRTLDERAPGPSRQSTGKTGIPSGCACSRRRKRCDSSHDRESRTCQRHWEPVVLKWNARSGEPTTGSLRGNTGISKIWLATLSQHHTRIPVHSSSAFQIKSNNAMTLPMAARHIRMPVRTSLQPFENGGADFLAAIRRHPKYWEYSSTGRCAG